MAEKRMFAKTIVLSDDFLDMPMSARCLYFTLSMLADDDGFVNSPRSVMRQAGCSVDDMRVLLAKQFVIAFETGVIVIRHWRINNYLRSDRYTETKCISEKKLLTTEEDGSYTVGIPTGIPSIDKISIDKNSIERGRFTPPTKEEIEAYCQEKGITIDVDMFIDHYKANNWKVGRTTMSDWKAAVRNWKRRDKEWKSAKGSDKYGSQNFEQKTVVMSNLDNMIGDGDEEW